MDPPSESPRDDPQTIDLISAMDQARPRDRLEGARLIVALWCAAVTVGILCAVLASFTEAATHWLTDSRSGYCDGLPFATREMCCVAPLGLPSASGESRTQLNAFLSGEASLPPCTQWKLWDGELSGASFFRTSLFGVIMYVTTSVILAVLAAVLAFNRPAVAGSGIVELKAFLSGVNLPGMFVPPVLLRKALGLCAAVGSGLAVGKEGPFVHLGACIAALVTRGVPTLRDSPLLVRELMSAGAAAGVAVAFGAPLGGVLFVLEESAFTLRRRAVLVCLVASSVAALTLRSIDVSSTGRIVQFAVSHHIAWQWFELPLFALLGFFGGCIGVVIVIGNGWLYSAESTNFNSHTPPTRHAAIAGAVVAWLRQASAHRPVMHVASIAMFTAIVSYSSPVLRRGMLEVLHDLFVECDHRPSASVDDRAIDVLCQVDSTVYLVLLLLFAAFVKAGLMTLIIGAKIPQGCFVPSLFVGASVGRAVGAMMQATYRTYPSLAIFAACGSDTLSAVSADHFNSDCVVPGVYAMIGAAALLTGVTRMTLSIAVIMFELTGGLEYVGPCLLASIVAKYTAEAMLRAPSLYDTQLLHSSLPYLDVGAADGEYSDVLDLNIAELLPTTPRDAVVLYDKMTVSDVRCVAAEGRTRAGTPPRWFPVLMSPSSPELVGCVSRSEVQRRLQQVVALQASENAHIVFTPSSGTLTPAVLMWANGLDPCVVRLTTAATVRHALLAFASLGVHHVVVCRGLQFAALLTRRDIFAFLKEKERNKMRSASTLVARGGAAASAETTEMVPRVVGTEGDEQL